jgi:hypothetical protein
MKYSLELELAVQATDSNRIDGHHWTVKNSGRKNIKQEIHYRTIGMEPEKPLAKFKIVIERHCPSVNFLDYDNMVTSFKPILDGLKNSKIIKGDTWKYITRENYFQDQIKSDRFMLKIRVEEVI